MLSYQWGSAYGYAHSVRAYCNDTRAFATSAAPRGSSAVPAPALFAHPFFYPEISESSGGMMYTRGSFESPMQPQVQRSASDLYAMQRVQREFPMGRRCRWPEALRVIP